MNENPNDRAAAVLREKRDALLEDMAWTSELLTRMLEAREAADNALPHMGAHRRGPRFSPTVSAHQEAIEAECLELLRQQVELVEMNRLLRVHRKGGDVVLAKLGGDA